MKRIMLGILWWCAMLAPDASGQALASPQLRAGEDLKVLYFTIRANYIIPDKVTVEEGWYRIVTAGRKRSHFCRSAGAELSQSVAGRQ